MRSFLLLGALSLLLCTVPVAGADDSQTTSAPAQRGGDTKPGLDGYCEAVCIGAPNVSTNCAGSCTAYDSTCSTPGHVVCNGVTTATCGHNPTPSVSLSCNVFFRTISCTANVSGGSGSPSYDWDYSGSATYLSENGATATAHWPPSGCSGTSTFDVTVTNSCGSASDSQTETCFF